MRAPSISRASTPAPPSTTPASPSRACSTAELVRDRLHLRRHGERQPRPLRHPPALAEQPRTPPPHHDGHRAPRRPARRRIARRTRSLTSLSSLPTSSGLIEPEALRAAMRPSTKLVSIMFANNETGTIQPIRRTRRHRARRRSPLPYRRYPGRRQAPPRPQPQRCELKDVDLLSISGHKMYAPQGTGILFVRRNVRASRPSSSVATTNASAVPGTENVPGIVALGKAADLARTWLTAPDTHETGPSNPSALARLRDRLEQGILARVVEASALPSGVNGANYPTRPEHGKSILRWCRCRGTRDRARPQGALRSARGSACQSGATEPSHVLLAMGLPDARARASIRISLSRQTTQAEVDTALRAHPRGRSPSPYPGRKALTVPLGASVLVPSIAMLLLLPLPLPIWLSFPKGICVCRCTCRCPSNAVILSAAKGHLVLRTCPYIPDPKKLSRISGHFRVSSPGIA